MARKKFKDTKVGAVLIALAPEPLKSVLKGVSDVSSALKSIRSSGIPDADKAALEKAYVDQQIIEDQEITKRWQSDNDAGTLTRFIRPSLLITLTVMMLVFTFLDSSDLYAFEVEDKWVDMWSLLAMTAYGAYFGGKSLEKTFLKKR